MPDFCTNCNVTMFADDTNIYGNEDDGKNDTKEKMSFWMKSNKLEIDKDKCKAISFGGTNELPEMKIFHYNIKLIDHINYLGAHLDSQLSFKSHI